MTATAGEVYFVYFINGIAKDQSLSNKGKIISWNLGNMLHKEGRCYFKNFFKFDFRETEERERENQLSYPTRMTDVTIKK